MSLTQSELDRYERQISISGWGLKGQQKLRATKVAVVGVGGLGCLASIYLASLGVGRLTLVDKGKFELSNLNRQILGWSDDVGRHKSEVAREKLVALNPEVQVEAVVSELDGQNACSLVGDADIVVDGQDNWKTRFILNDCCVTRKKPFIHAGVFAMRGQITTILPGKGPCLRCIFPKNPSETERVPVLGATPALLASLQVLEVAKIVVGIGEPLSGRILFVSGEDMVFEAVDIKRDRDCPVCRELWGQDGEERKLAGNL